jgi:hypothetical protein
MVVDAPLRKARLPVRPEEPSTMVTSLLGLLLLGMRVYELFVFGMLLQVLVLGLFCFLQLALQRF